MWLDQGHSGVDKGRREARKIRKVKFNAKMGTQIQGSLPIINLLPLSSKSASDVGKENPVALFPSHSPGTLRPLASLQLTLTLTRQLSFHGPLNVDNMLLRPYAALPVSGLPPHILSVCPSSSSSFSHTPEGCLLIAWSWNNAANFLMQWMGITPQPLTRSLSQLLAGRASLLRFFLL